VVVVVLPICLNPSSRSTRTIVVVAAAAAAAGGGGGGGAGQITRMDEWIAYLSLTLVIHNSRWWWWYDNLSWMDG